MKTIPLCVIKIYIMNTFFFFFLLYTVYFVFFMLNIFHMKGFESIRNVSIFNKFIS